MPTFDLDIDVDEFFYELDTREKNQLLTLIINDYVPLNEKNKILIKNLFFSDDDDDELLFKKIKEGLWKLSTEDQETFKKIIDKIII